MTKGKGKMKIGSGKGGNTKRKIPSQQVQVKQWQKLSNGSIRLCARRGGVKRINKNVYFDAKQSLKEYMEKVIRNSVIYMQNDGRKTMTPMDVVYGLKKLGKNIFGFGG